VDGLAALWRHFLRESVTAEGGKGFANFNLWWQDEGRSVGIEGSWEALVRLRGWILGRGGEQVAPGDVALLRGVAAAHARLVLAGESSRPIAGLASAADGREDFEGKLETLG
jgi:hypothetical protein